MIKLGRILYLQYTNPAVYPPLEHSSTILSGRWELLFLGIGSLGAEEVTFDRPRNVSLMAPATTGWRQKLRYVNFIVWTVARAILFRPDWIYTSDASACPAARLVGAMTRARIIYHEHDTFVSNRMSWLMRQIMRQRDRLARQADLCVLPQRERLDYFVEQTGRKGPVECVWNCPTQDEIRPAREPLGGGALICYYHGTLNPKRLPESVIRGLAKGSDTMRLIIVGYETVGHKGYIQSLLELARTIGVGDRVQYLGTIARREDMLASCSKADIGLALMPADGGDFNLQHMAGASNKPFDYLACGLALLVSDQPQWRQLYVEKGMALHCDPDDEDSLAKRFAWFDANRDEVRNMGETGRRRVLEEWNYEAQFAPVQRLLEGSLATIGKAGDLAVQDKELSRR